IVGNDVIEKQLPVAFVTRLGVRMQNPHNRHFELAQSRGKRIDGLDDVTRADDLRRSARSAKGSLHVDDDERGPPQAELIEQMIAATAGQYPIHNLLANAGAMHPGFPISPCTYEFRSPDRAPSINPGFQFPDFARGEIRATQPVSRLHNDDVLEEWV